MRCHDLEEGIFEEWRERSRGNGDGTEIAPDGLLYRGAFSYEDGYWSRRPGDEEGRWERAERRVLILTKDLNDEEAWDVRCETGRRNFSGEGDGGGVGSVLQESDAVGVRVADGGRGGADGAVRGGGQAGGVPSVLRRGGGGTGELQEAGGRELAGQRGVAVVSGAVRGFAGKANRAV